MIDCVVIFQDGSRLPAKLSGYHRPMLEIDIDPTTPVQQYPPELIVGIHIPDQGRKVHAHLVGLTPGPTLQLIDMGPSPP